MIIKKLYIDSNNLYGHSMTQPIPYDEIEFDKNVKLEDILNTPDDSDCGYFIQIDLKYPDILKNFPFAPESNKINPDDFSDYVKTIKTDTYTQTKKLISDWSDKKNCLNYYSMFKFYVRHGMKVVEVHTVISFLNRVNSWKKL